MTGPVQPALRSTNDQLTLTAIALGAPASAVPTTPTPAPVPTPAPAPAPVQTPSPSLGVRVVFSNAWVSSAAVDKRFRARITASGGSEAFTWSLRGRLPAGLKGKPTPTGRAYLIKGRPAKTGVFTFKLTATDASGASVTRRYKIRVS